VTQLVLYSRPECHLCEELLEQLGPMLEPTDKVRIVDIDGDIGLERRYGPRIPVLTTEDGLELSSYPFDRDRVANYLAESR
jgi:hypothetical protein